MSADSDRAIEAFRAERRFWVDLGEGRRIQMEMLTKPSLAGLMRETEKISGLEASVHIASKRIVGWRLLERHVFSTGGDEPVPFDKAIAAEWLEVHYEAAEIAVKELFDRFRAEDDRLAQSEKN